MPEAVQPSGLPYWVRWASVLWLAVWIPSYAVYWGWTNFLHLCDVAVFLTCIGLASSNALLLSSQAVSSLVADLLWCLDAGSRWFLGRHLLGGTEYMFDPQLPLFIRLLSLFHVVTPPLLLWAIWRLGYDPRGWKLQTLTAWVVVPINYFWRPEQDVNWARGPFFREQHFMPGWAYLLVYLVAVPSFVYFPTHLFLGWLTRLWKGTAR